MDKISLLFGFVVGLIVSNILTHKYNVRDRALFYVLRRKVMKIFSGMDYSIEKNLLEFTESMTIDFKSKNIVFNGFYPGKKSRAANGVCGDLAYHVYVNIPDYLRNYFSLKIVVGTESNYFYKDGKSNFSHVFLSFKRSDGSTHVIDPTFKRMLPYDNYSYEIDMVVPPKSVLSEHEMKIEITDNITYNFFPIKMVGEYLLLLGIKMVDPENFSFLLTSKKRYSRSFNRIALFDFSKGELDITKTHNFEHFRGKELKSVMKLALALEEKLKYLIKNAEIVE